MGKLEEEIDLYLTYHTNLPLKMEIDANELVIDWGDGDESVFSRGTYFQALHSYSQEMKYKIRISGHKINSLNVSGVNLSLLELKHCPALEYLNCAINELKELDLSHCPALEELYCNSNNLIKLDLNRTPLLTQLQASYNRIKELDVSSCTQIQTLHCSNNRIDTFHFEGCRQIYYLNLSQNQLKKEELIRISEELSTQNPHATISLLKNPDNEG